MLIDCQEECLTQNHHLKCYYLPKERSSQLPICNFAESFFNIGGVLICYYACCSLALLWLDEAECLFHWVPEVVPRQHCGHLLFRDRVPLLPVGGCGKRAGCEQSIPGLFPAFLGALSHPLSHDGKPEGHYDSAGEFPSLNVQNFVK